VYCAFTKLRVSKTRNFEESLEIGRRTASVVHDLTLGAYRMCGSADRLRGTDGTGSVTRDPTGPGTPMTHDPD